MKKSNFLMLPVVSSQTLALPCFIHQEERERERSWSEKEESEGQCDRFILFFLAVCDRFVQPGCTRSHLLSTLLKTVPLVFFFFNQSGLLEYTPQTRKTETPPVFGLTIQAGAVPLIHASHHFIPHRYRTHRTVSL